MEQAQRNGYQFRKLYSMLICTRHKLTHLAGLQLDIYCGTTRLGNISSQIHLGRGSQPLCNYLKWDNIKIFEEYWGVLQ